MTAPCFSLHDTRWTWRLTGCGRQIVCYYRGGDNACWISKPFGLSASLTVDGSLEEGNMVCTRVTNTSLSSVRPYGWLDGNGPTGIAVSFNKLRIRRKCIPKRYCCKQVGKHAHAGSQEAWPSRTLAELGLSFLRCEHGRINVEK